MKSLLRPKKVTLQDVASPKPSRAAARVVKDALKQSYADQKAVSRRAEAMRSN